MSTSKSPEAKLRAEAKNIAIGMKRLKSSKPEITVGVVMDDKIIKITMALKVIEDTSQGALEEMVYAQMRGEVRN